MQRAHPTLSPHAEERECAASVPRDILLPMKRASIVLIAVVALSGTAHAADKIHVGKAQGTAWTFLPVDIGIEQGLFARQNLDVDSANLGGDAKVQQA